MEQLAAGRGQGHPWPLWPAAARFCVFSSLLQHRGIPITRRDGARRARTAGRRRRCAIRGHRRAGSPPKMWPAAPGQGAPSSGRPWWAGSPPVWPPGSPFGARPRSAAGGGQGRPKRVGRRASGRVTPRFVDSIRLWHILDEHGGQCGGPGVSRGPRADVLSKRLIGGRPAAGQTAVSTTVARPNLAPYHSRGQR